MAQRKAMQRRARALIRRFGLGGEKKVAMACVMLLVAAVGLGAYLQAGQYVTVERGDEASEAAGLERSWPTKAAEGEQGQSAEPEGSTRGAPANANDAVPDVTETVVHVDGAVASPGVYALDSECPRINDAVELAGGLLPDADTSGINLAQPLADGQKVHVPYEGEEASPDAQAAVDSVGASGPVATGGSRVNINTASPEELQRLPGVGEATAASIVDDRERNGPFSMAEDLMRVSGIGEKKFDKMRDMIDV